MSQRILRLAWQTDLDPDQLTTQLDAAFADGVARVELVVPEPSAQGQRAAHRAGMRREGRLRQALLTEQGPVDGLLYAVLADDRRHGCEVFSSVMNSVLPKTRVIAHTVITDRPWSDPQARFLLLEVSYKSDWELPGGVVEPYESPRQGAAREIEEELGLHLRPGRLLVLDWLPAHLGWDDAVELLFDGGVLTTQTRLHLAAGEVVAAHWVSVEEAIPQLSPLAARRIRWLADHRQAGPTYFEAGSPAD